MKITLAICTNRGIRPKTAQCLLDLMKSEYEIHPIVCERGYTIAENRNYAVVQAQKNQSEYLFFIDDDMTFSTDVLDRLLAHKKDVVGVNSYSRCLPLASTVGLMDKDGKYKHPDRFPAWEMKIPDELFEAYFVGTGICLIDMRVFDGLTKPYFTFTYDDNGQVKNGEDGWFCDQVRKAGMKVWCDPTIEVGHLGEIEYGKKLEKLYVSS